ncbi:MAG: ABC transporter ATP-binding protein [Rhodoglobus sp.]
MVREPLLEVDGMSTTFSVRSSTLFGRKHELKAVRGISFEVRKGETYALVGESGCGKTTTGRTIIGLETASEGSATLRGKTLFGAGGDAAASKSERRRIQMIFQDPYSSLNPKKRVGVILDEALKISGSTAGVAQRRQLVLDVLNRVGFGAEYYSRFPHEFSGGQRQRIGIARALIVEPDLIICDEAVSALDVSIQAQILNLLRELQRESGLSYLFVSHDLGVVRHIADRIGVMYLGEIVEETSAGELFARPLHPYTRALLSAVPVADPAVRGTRHALEGEVPTPLNPPPGCVFSSRCPIAVPLCSQKAPDLVATSDGHRVACHLVGSTPSTNADADTTAPSITSNEKGDTLP